MDQLSFVFEHPAVGQIRSHYKTLDRYRKTSIALHNRPVGSVFALASMLTEAVNTIAADFPQDMEVQRWRRKFNEYVEQYELVDFDELETKGAKDEYEESQENEPTA